MSEEKWGIVYDGSSTWSLGPVEDPQDKSFATIFVRGEAEEERWREIYPRIVRVPDMERENDSLRSQLSAAQERVKGLEEALRAHIDAECDCVEWGVPPDTHLTHCAAARRALSPTPEGGEG